MRLLLLQMNRKEYFQTTLCHPTSRPKILCVTESSYKRAVSRGMESEILTTDSQLMHQSIRTSEQFCAQKSSGDAKTAISEGQR